MGQALPKPALRPFLAADTPVLVAIFVAAIEELTGEDYSEAQQEAWASAADDEERFGKRLAGDIVGPNTYSKSAVGHLGFFDLLPKLGYRVSEHVPTPIATHIVVTKQN